jgi:putative OPT family oligopeptide transporter
MQLGDIIGVVIASLVMYFPLIILHQGDINAGGVGFGGEALPAPQASLMALVSKGIVGGKMAWPLIFAGILMTVVLIFVQVKSPMLICVGMYLPLQTTFAIFIGGLVRALPDFIAERRRFNEGQKARVENNGVLLSSGLIAGEALIGLLFAGLAFKNIAVPKIIENPSFITSLFVFVVIGIILTAIPIRNAGKPDEPAPPSAV